MVHFGYDLKSCILIDNLPSNTKISVAGFSKLSTHKQERMAWRLVFVLPFVRGEPQQFRVEKKASFETVWERSDINVHIYICIYMCMYDMALWWLSSLWTSKLVRRKLNKLWIWTNSILERALGLHWSLMERGWSEVTLDGQHKHMASITLEIFIQGMRLQLDVAKERVQLNTKLL